MNTLALPDNPHFVRALLIDIRKELDDLRLDYALIRGIQDGSVKPQRYEQLLESVTQAAQDRKTEMEEIRNGTYTIELSH